jgi:hypothetical protein
VCDKKLYLSQSHLGQIPSQAVAEIYLLSHHSQSGKGQSPSIILALAEFGEGKPSLSAKNKAADDQPTDIVVFVHPDSPIFSKSLTTGVYCKL